MPLRKGGILVVYKCKKYVIHTREEMVSAQSYVQIIY